MITQIIKYYGCSSDSGCWSPLSGVSHPPPSLTALWRCHLPFCWSGFGQGQVPSLQPLQRPCVPSEPPGWFHGTKHQSWRAQCREGLFITSWTTQTWRDRFTKGIQVPHLSRGTELYKKRAGGLEVAFELPSFRILARQTKFPPGQASWAPPLSKEGKCTAQGWLLCSGIHENWMIGSNACTWGSAKPAQRTAAVPANLREALQAVGWMHCSPHLGLQKYQNMSCGTQALEWHSGHLCSITTTKHFLCPRLLPLPLRRVIPNIHKSTTNSDRWKILNRAQFKLAGAGEKHLAFPLLQILSSVRALSIAKPWELNLPSHSFPYKHQLWSYGNCTAAALWSPVISLSAPRHFRLQTPPTDPVRAAKGPQGTSLHISMAWQNPSARGHRSTGKAPSGPVLAKPYDKTY